MDREPALPEDLHRESADVGKAASGPLGVSVRFVSDDVADVLGYAPHDFYADPGLWLSAVHPDDLPGLQELTRSILAGQVPGVRRYRMRHRDTGELVWMEDVVSPQLDRSGRIAIVQGFARDVKGREPDAGQPVLITSAVEQTTDCVFITDSTGVIMYANRAVEAMTGYSADELVGATPALFKSGEHDAGFYRSLWGAILAGRVFRAVFTNRKKTGEIFYEEQAISPVRNADGTIAHFVSTGRDITEQRLADEALRVSEAWLRLESKMLQSVGEAVIATDLSYGILFWNKAAERIYGWKSREVLGRNIMDVAPAEQSRGQAKEIWAALHEAGRSWHGELLLRHRDGHSFPALVTESSFLDDSGQLAGFIGVSSDISERKRTEAEREALEARLFQSQRMETVGQLAGGIAHDFNNLINVISGTAFLVAEQLQAGDPVREDVREITRAADRAAALTRQLLAFSRQQIMQPKVLDLGALVLDLEGMLRRLIGEDVDLAVMAARGLGGIRADPGQIEQVIVNLAVNARDAMSTGGALTITVAAVDLDEAHAGALPPMQPGPHMMLTVSDTGTGMDEATRARIFEPFFTTKEVGRGTGLGLSTVDGIVQQSGGTIRVDGEVAKGTSFRIWFPRVDEPVYTDQAAPQVAPQRGAETILVVEDYLGLRTLARRMLEKAGYTVLLAGNGNEALQLLESHDGPVHLVLTDVVMPGMGGRDLAAWIMEARPETRVIYASGYTNDALLRHGVDTAAVHLLSKPYTNEALTRTVRMVLDAG